MLDLIYIALDSITDDSLFEKLASEIMRDEGYPNIKSLGGLSDKGVDAVQDRFYLHEGRSRIVFQYTLQKYLSGKIDDTVRTLSDNGISYHELVLVTHRSISSERQRSLIETARKKHGVTLSIFERNTIANRLANRENNIFVRYFPDIETQLAALTTKRPLLSSDESGLLEISMLKSSIAFTFNKDAPRVRKSIFDFLTLGLLLEKPSEYILVAKLRERYGITSGKEQPPEDKVRSSLNRLTERGLIEWQGDGARLSSKALEIVDGSTAGANDATRSLITDIVDEVCQTSHQRISEDDKLKMERNIQDVLVMLFRLSGIEIANQVLKGSTPGPVYLDSMPEFVARAKRQLPPDLGELLISFISQKLATPSAEQARTLASWSLTYIGVEVMNLDPDLKEFQRTRLAKKTFVLDTDFILRCLVREFPRRDIPRPCQDVPQSRFKGNRTRVMPERVRCSCPVFTANLQSLWPQIVIPQRRTRGREGMECFCTRLLLRNIKWWYSQNDDLRKVPAELLHTKQTDRIHDGGYRHVLSSRSRDPQSKRLTLSRGPRGTYQ